MKLYLVGNGVVCKASTWMWRVYVLIACGAILQSDSRCIATDRPNFVIIFMDDMSWVGSSVQMDPNNPDSKSDYHRTPNMEALASQGMVFSNAYASGPMCSPTRAAFITGKSPAQMQVTDVRNAADFSNPHYQQNYVNHPLTPPVPLGTFYNETTLAEAIKQVDSRYRAAYYGKSDWWPSPLTEGWDAYKTEQINKIATEVDPKGMYTITSLANEYMETQVAAGRPFFVTLGHYAVKPMAYWPDTFPESYDEFEGVPPGAKHHDRIYAAQHKELDNTIGLVMDKIAALGVEDNTYVILTSDHGAAIGVENQDFVNAPLYGGKGTIWEGGLRVPFIVKGPGIAPSSYSDIPVNLIDVLPTMVDLAGGTGALPDGVEGTSLKPILHNDGALPSGQTALARPWGSNGELFFHYPHYGPALNIGTPTPASVVRDGDFKLVRIYGENGAPNSFLLFNLAENIQESSDPSSPLNLASLMPEKVAELDAKLENWLQGVDASMAYDIRNPMTLRWRGDTNWHADRPGVQEDEWRTVNNVDSYQEETWRTISSSDTTVPRTMDAASYQPRLSKKAMVFDGNDGLHHKFFQVSDPNSTAIDGDNSATIQAWVRFDDLNSEQLLFESGSAGRGMSLTLGDANGDSVNDELRFRVVGASANNSLSLTADINQFVNPTKDFVHLTAVVSDRNGDSYLEIYVNGALAGRIDGGSQPLDWDGNWQASLGAISPNTSTIGHGGTVDTLGGASGSGDLPFSGGNLRGEIAELEFRNYALEANQIREQYNSYLDNVSTGIQMVSGDTAVPAFRPSDVSLNMSQSSSLLVIEERRDVLATDLTVNAVVTGPLSLGSHDEGTTGTLPAGTEFTSYLLHFDPTSNNGSVVESLNGSVGFAEKIVGIAIDPDLLVESDAELGSIGNYGPGGNRGLIFTSGSFLNISPDRLRLDFSLSVRGDELLQFRVLTEKLTMLPSDFNFDGLVDDVDLSIWRASYGSDDGGDADGDGDTDGRDFLVWQREHSPALFNSPGSDFNRDGLIDAADLSIWQASFGINNGGDADGDGDTDGRDFLSWQREYASAMLKGSSYRVVPEPYCLALCLVGGVLTSCLRHR